MSPFAFSPGDAPLLMSVPHVGTGIPDAIAAGLTPAALGRPDTDWHLDRLYDFVPALGIPVLQSVQSRYVIDLNRDPSGAPLYPGASNTELVPTATFAEEPIYRQAPPEEAEIAARRETYWRPYHERLAAELAAIRDRHDVAVLFDCHSIKSVVPRFFEGRLPDFNLGTGAGEACAAALRDRLADALGTGAGYSLAVDGRFKGGYITRHYGDPANGVHAFQLELSLATYMEESPPFAFRDDLAEQVRPSLRAMVEAALAWAREQATA